MPRLMLTLLLCLAGATQAQPAPEAADFALSASLQDLLIQHAGGALPSKVLTGFSTTRAATVKGLLGGTSAETFKAELVRQDNGLTGARTSTAAANGQSANHLTGVNLCGLVGLLNESKLTVESAGNTVLPIGKLFIPFGFKTSNDYANRARLTAFETTAPVLCQPEPGSRFEYTTETENIFKSSGMFGRTRTTSVKRTAACQVAAEARPAKDLHADLEGEYLEVRCNTTVGEGRAGKSRYAYLTASRFYVSLEDTNDSQSILTTLTGASYARAE